MNMSKNPATEGPISEHVGGYISEEAIRERAYERYMQRRGIDGLEVEDWLGGEAELLLSTLA